MEKRALMTFAFALALVALPGSAMAGTVSELTVVTPEPVAGTTESINLESFDLNKDGMLTRKEIGTRLFYLYDADGNEVIDNIEYGQPRMMTIVPMKQEKFLSVDLNDDGAVDVADYNQDRFIKETMLSRFDHNKDGLSAKEFLGTWFTRPDKDKSHVIEIDEWRQVYTEAMKGRINDQETYNN